MYKVVFLRHGESVWNKENRFTGWTDIGLSQTGIKEAELAGQTLLKEGHVFDLAFTSVLIRAIDTTKIVLEQLGLGQIKTRYAWQLNERHYGALQGLNKSEMAQKYGQDQVYVWRRSFCVRPPDMSEPDFEKQNQQKIFKDIPQNDLPKSESLKDTYNRAVGYWNLAITPAIEEGAKILVSIHGNSLRAIVKHLDDIPDDEISHLNIPTGIPLVYELDDNLKPINHYYLGDQTEIDQKIKKIKEQGKA